MLKGDNKRGSKRMGEESPDRLNRLVSGTKLTGDLITNSSLRVDGEIKGDVKCEGRLVVGEEGLITGDLSAIEVELNGTVIGDINAQVLLTLHQSAVVKGDVSTERLVIEDGAKIEGKIFTGSQRKGAAPSNTENLLKDKETKDSADMVY